MLGPLRVLHLTNERGLLCGQILAALGADVVQVEPFEASRFRLGRTPARIEGTAPALGRDNAHVLETILGYDEERITALVVEGALE